jgi:hypothetical protein
MRHTGRLTVRRASLAAGLGAVVFALTVWFTVGHSWLDRGSPPELRAAIVDQLGATEPNPEFVSAASSLLSDGGYAVDYYPPESVSVGLYRTLQNRGYSFVIIRAHSTATAASGVTLGETLLFTNETYDPERYPGDPVGWAFDGRGSPRSFGISAEFIESSMESGFEGATVLLMGCETLSTPETAEAILGRGARQVFGWKGAVSASQTDRAMLDVVRRVVADGESGSAVLESMEPGLLKDESFGGELAVLVQ